MNAEVFERFTQPLIDGEHQAIIDLTSRQSVGEVRLDLHSLHKLFELAASVGIR
jgi:hypothetical protein